MSKKIAVATLLVFCFGALCSFAFGSRNEYYDKYEKYKYGFFPYYSTISEKTSDKDKVKAEEFLSQVESMLECTDKADEESFGELTYFNEKTLKYEAKKVQADVRLISAKFSFAGAYIWGEYDCKRYGADGNILSSETDSLFYLKLKKSDGFYVVTNIKTI